MMIPRLKQAEIIWFNSTDLLGMLRTENGDYLHINGSVFSCIDENMKQEVVLKRLSDLQGNFVDVELEGSRDKHNLKVKRVHITLLARNY